MGCLLCCFCDPEVDQEDEDPDDGQQIQQPNATTNRSTEVQDIAFEVCFKFLIPYGVALH